MTCDRCSNGLLEDKTSVIPWKTSSGEINCIHALSPLHGGDINSWTHGLQYTFLWNALTDWCVPYCDGKQGPNSEIVGVWRLNARCIGPESLVINNFACFKRRISWSSEVSRTNHVYSQRLTCEYISSFTYLLSALFPIIYILYSGNFSLSANDNLTKFWEGHRRSIRKSEALGLITMYWLPIRLSFFDSQ